MILLNAIYISEFTRSSFYESNDYESYDSYRSFFILDYEDERFDWLLLSDSKNKKTLNGAAVFVVLVTILGETLVCWNLKNKSEIYFRKIHLEKIALPFLSSTLRLNQTISAAGLALRTRHWSTTSSPSRDGIRAPAAWSTISTLLGGTVKKQTQRRDKRLRRHVFLRSKF